MDDYIDDDFNDLLDDDGLNHGHGGVFEEGSYGYNNLNYAQPEVVNLDEVQSDFEDPADDESEEEEELSPEAEAELLRFANEMSNVTDDELMQLMAVNQSYLEVIQKQINRTDQAIDENREAQDALFERMSASKRSEKPDRGVAWSQYVKPYFKDEIGMTPQNNSEAVELIRTHQLTTLLREERIWLETDINKLTNGVKRVLLRLMNRGLNARIDSLKDKIKNYGALNTEEEREAWKSEIKSLEYRINENNELPDAEIFKGDYSNVPWQEISIVDFDLQRSATACKMRWCNEQCPQINKAPWTEEEDQKILEAAKEHWTNWGFLADELGTNRSEYQIAIRTKELEVKNSDDRVPWTLAEDEKLISIVHSMRNIAAIPWNKIAKLLGNRTPLQCRTRFENSLASNLQFGRWTEAEDMFLLDAVNRYGPFDWFRISEKVPGRSAQQCRSRWACCLFINRSTSPWTLEEDEILLMGLKIFGRGNWSAISNLLTQRLPSDIVTRFRSFVNSKIQGYIYCNRNVQVPRTQRNSLTISRFQAMEEITDPRGKQLQALSNRFGMGNYVLGKDKEVRDMTSYLEEKKKDSRVYHLFSGRWKKLMTPEECRRQNYVRKYKELTDEKREILENFITDLEERRTKREAEQAEVIQELGEDDADLAFYTLTEDEIDAAVEKNIRLAEEVVVVVDGDVEMLMRKKLPRVRIRKRKPKRRGRKPSDLIKVPKSNTDEELREQCFIIRNMKLTPMIANLFNMPERMTIRADGSQRRVDEIVLNEDHDGNLHWITQHEDFVLGVLLALNQFMFRTSMYNYENDWRHNNARRSKDYYLRQLTLSSVPAVFPYNPVEPPALENFEHLLSDVMLPCRGTLVAVQEYRKRGKSIASGLAHYYFDPLNNESTHEVLEGATFDQISQRRLDICLPTTITDSIDYLVLRARMYKLFFLPMLMDYGQRSAASRAKLASELTLQRNRRQKEAAFSRTGEIHEGELTIFGDDNVRLAREGMLTDVVRQLQAQNTQINESINTIVENASSAIKMESSTITEMDSPADPVNDVVDSVASTSQSVEALKTVPPKRRRNRKKDPVEKAAASHSSEPGPSSSKRPRFEDNTEVILDLNGYVGPNIGAYKPRWVQQSLKKRKETGGTELTLADLLFVKGRNRRVPSGTYDLAHREGILDKIRPVIEHVLENGSNRSSRPSSSNTGEQPSTSK